jgi:MG2 domain
LTWSRARKLLVGLAAFGLLCGLGCLSMVVCLPAWLTDGIRVGQCPDGAVRPTLYVDVGGLRRGSTGTVSVRAIGHYTPGTADQDWTADIHRLSAKLSLVDPAGEVTPLKPEEGWDGWGTVRSALIRLPDNLPDGDYILRVEGDTAAGPANLDVPLPLYAPARVHVLTDRPLYEPGNVVRFRSLALRARDLTPLDGRPGRWTLTDPNGEVLLDERAPAGAWGVASGSFPLDASAESGTWTLTWTSGDAVGQSSFQVEPFTLPRFRLEVAAQQPWHRTGDRPVLKGKVVYSSGAPVAEADVEIEWSVAGAWPPPTTWMDEELPQSARTDRQGAFTLLLPVVPADLQGEATLLAQLSAVDPAGDRATGSAQVKLSETPILATAVTELQGGLVDGFNNRVYLRITTPDGVPLPLADLQVRRAWDPADPGMKAKTDEDGVAALQLDPGPPVNVVVPALPLRLPPARPQATRGDGRELLEQRSLNLAEQLGLDRLTDSLEGCANYAGRGAVSTTVALRVDSNGRVLSAVGRDEPADLCVARKLEGAFVAPGGERVLAVSWTLDGTDLPSLNVQVDAVTGPPDGLASVLGVAALDARACLPVQTHGGEIHSALSWRVRTGERSINPTWVAIPSARQLPSPVDSCVRQVFAATTLAAPATTPGAGIVRLSVVEPDRVTQARPQATARLGYELSINATSDGVTLGETRLLMDPGAVPPLRLRATPILPAVGADVEIELVRGPGFSGDLPEELWMRHERGSSVKAKVDRERRLVRWTLPADLTGWFEVIYGDAIARVYVAPKADLDLALSTDQPSYAPGATARLQVQTSSQGQGVAAAVSLLGVDQSLGQLVTLPGADSLDGLRPSPTTDQPAFGSMDGQALTMGRIRGANAAAATVLRISSIPAAADLDTAVYTSHGASFEPLADLTDHFYSVLTELHQQVRAWEQSAPKAEQMSPKKMASLWDAALRAAKQQGHDVSDAYGRPLRLSVLPPDLLALTDPRAVIVDGTRNPEDVENWADYVAREEP